MRLKEIYRSPNYYSICVDDRTGNRIIYVIAGGVLMYAVVVALTSDESQAFEKTGNLDGLARQIAQRPSLFESRMFKPATRNEKIEFVSSL